MNRQGQLIVLALVVLAKPAAAQRVTPPITTAAILLPTRFGSDLRTGPASPPPTYWLEGGVIGGFGLGFLGAALGGGLCGYSDQQKSCTGATVSGAVFGAGLGFIVGGIIGGQIPKHPDDSPP